MYSGRYWSKKLCAITDKLDCLEEANNDKLEEYKDLRYEIKQSIKQSKNQYKIKLPDTKKVEHFCDGLALTKEDLEYLNSNDHIKHTVKMIIST